MATLSTSISDKAWGQVDKGALGRAVAAAYAKGGITRAQIRQIYLYVPDDAFGKDGDGKPQFTYTSAKMPVAELSGSTITINRNGVHAAAGAMAGARSTPDMPADAMTAAKRKMRGLYRKLKESPPASLKESIEPFGGSKPFEELVKGSGEYTLERIEACFREQFQEPSPYYAGETWRPYRIEDTFADVVIVRDYGNDELLPDEFYRIAYAGNDLDGYTFDPYEKWQVVEMTYQPAQSSAAPAQPTTSSAQSGDAGSGGMMDSASPARGSKRFVETIADAAITLEESAAEENTTGPWKIKAIGNTADRVNTNERRYPAAVLEAAVSQLRQHLHESAGQGRLLGEKTRQPTGESDHPGDKGNQRALLGETIIVWQAVDFDGQHILLEGNLLGTAKGKDFRAQVKGGLHPGMSQRGYGESVTRQEGTETIEEVTRLTITGFDPTLPGDQSDADSQITFVEKNQQGGHAGPPQQENEEMTKEQLEQFIKEHPELFKGVTLEEVQKMSAEQLKAFEEKYRAALGIGPDADLVKELAEAAAAKKELTEAKRLAAVEAAIVEQTKDLKYPKQLSEAFIANVRAADCADAAAVKALVESKRKEYDALAATLKLAGMGYSEGRITGVAPVLEIETGTPEFARASHMITESIIRAGDPHVRRRDFRDMAKLSINEVYARTYLERLDKVYGPYLRVESKKFEEAETAADLDLPYSVSRAIVAQAIPELIATSIFDMGVTNVSPFKIGYESYVAETGLVVTITDESVDLGDKVTAGYVALAHNEIVGATVVVTSSPAGTNYEEGTDYTIDYLNGRLYPIGALASSSATLLVDYHYTAVRKGEGLTIERAEVHLAWKTMDASAMRLAAQINREAVVFSQAQIGYDAVTRTIVALINQLRRRIDFGLMKMAKEAATRQASNSGGSWTSSGTDYDVFVRALGAAKVKVAKRFYTPTAHLMSTTTADLIANWTGFTQAGSRPDANLNANGYVGSLKGLPVFSSTEFDDDVALTFNREIVMHRVFLPMRLDGPHDVYSGADSTSMKLVPAQEWYAEEFNASEVLVPEKAAYVVIA